MRPPLVIAAVALVACSARAPDAPLEPPGGRDTSRRGLHSSFNRPAPAGPVTPADRDRLAGRYRSPNADGRPERSDSPAVGEAAVLANAPPAFTGPAPADEPTTPAERDRQKGTYLNPNKDGKPERQRAVRLAPGFSATSSE